MTRLTASLLVIALLTLGFGVAADANQIYSIAAASPGGTYYGYASGWSELLRHAHNMNVVVEVTGGATDNLQLVDAFQTEFGLATMSLAYEAFHGMGSWPRKLTNIRAVIPGYTNYFHFYVRGDAGIRSVRDLAGKRVQLGPSGSTQDYYGRAIFKALGIEPERIINVPYSDANNMMRDGLLDAAFLTAGLPNASILEMEATQDIAVIGIGGEDAEKFLEEFPYLAVQEIPAGTYKSVTSPLPTLTSTNFIIAHKDVPADVVDKAVRATFDHLNILVTGHKAAEETAPELVTTAFIPLHAGAVAYYQERGIDVSSLLPPEGN